MFQLLQLVREAPCENPFAALRWFAAQRVRKSADEFMLMLKVNERRVRIPIGDTPTLCAALALFTRRNPWARWQPGAPPGLIVDLGANVGLASLYFSLRFPQAEVAAVEMMPANAAAISRLAALNGLAIRVLNVAVGDQNGTATVRCSRQHTRHSLADLGERPDPAWEFTEERVSVPMIRLGDVLAALGRSRIDLLKVDIEGAEELLLRDIAAWKAHVEAVLLELHHNMVALDAESAMKSHGFKKIGEDLAGRNELWFVR